MSSARIKELLTQLLTELDAARVDPETLLLMSELEADIHDVLESKVMNAQLADTAVGRGAQGNLMANTAVPIAGLDHEQVFAQLEQVQNVIGECAAAVVDMLTLVVGNPEALDLAAVRELMGVIVGSIAVSAYAANVREAAAKVRGVLERMY